MAFYSCWGPDSGYSILSKEVGSKYRIQTCKKIAYIYYSIRLDYLTDMLTSPSEGQIIDKLHSLNRYTYIKIGPESEANHIGIVQHCIA